MGKSSKKMEKIKNKIVDQKIKQSDVEDFIDELEDVEEKDYENIIENILELEVEVEDFEDEQVDESIDESENYYIDDNIKQYFMEIAKYPPLSPKEEKALIKKVKSGDKEAEDLLITSNLRLVSKLALQYAKSGVYYLDLVQDGTIGLMKAIKKFDISKGYKLSTYATWWIKKEIIESLKGKLNFIKIPNYIFLSYQKIKAAEKEISQETNQTPSVEKIAEKLKMDTDEVTKIITIIDSNKIKSNDDKEIGIEFQDNRLSESIEREINNLSQKIKVSNMLKKLSNKEKEIIELYFGLSEDGERYNYKDIGEKLGLSSERVRIIAKRALKKLRYVGVQKWKK